MKKLTLFILAACCISINAQLNIATYNIRNNSDYDRKNNNGWEQRCPVICNMIKFHNFDIIGMQEVKHGQINDMLELLPEYDYIGVGRDDGKTAGEYTPIYYNRSKIKLLETGNFWLSETTDIPSKGWDANLPRVCTWGKFKMGKKTFWVFNTHFDHIGVQARLESSKLILAKMEEMCGNQPALLMGDFNINQFNEGYILINSSDFLDDSFEKAKFRYASNGTFNDFSTNHKSQDRIDHIFVTESIKVLRYGILTDMYWAPKNPEAKKKEYIIRAPSDHYPVNIIVNLR